MAFSTFRTILDNFQFAEPLWLWGLTVLPVLWAIYALSFRQHFSGSKLESFADPHLLPHLLGDETKQGPQKNHTVRTLAIWSLVWALGLLAMAGPRWDYTDVKAYVPASNLVILLDLSRSMDAADVKPSRLARARQESSAPPAASISA